MRLHPFPLSQSEAYLSPQFSKWRRKSSTSSTGTDRSSAAQSRTFAHGFGKHLAGQYVVEHVQDTNYQIMRMSYARGPSSASHTASKRKKFLPSSSSTPIRHRWSMLLAPALLGQNPEPNRWTLLAMMKKGRSQLLFHLHVAESSYCSRLFTRGVRIAPARVALQRSSKSAQRSVCALNHPKLTPIGPPWKLCSPSLQISSRLTSKSRSASSVCPTHRNVSGKLMFGQFTNLRPFEHG